MGWYGTLPGGFVVVVAAVVVVVAVVVVYKLWLSNSMEWYGTMHEVNLGSPARGHLAVMRVGIETCHE